MSLKDSVKDALIEQLEKLEGCVNHFYLDSVGKVTIGIGHQVVSEDAAAELPLYIPRMFNWCCAVQLKKKSEQNISSCN